MTKVIKRQDNWIPAVKLNVMENDESINVIKLIIKHCSLQPNARVAN